MPSGDPVIAAVEDWLTGWTGLVNCPQSRLNEADESELEQFIDIEYPVRNEDLAADKTYRESGVIRFVIHVTTLAGADEAAGWVEEIRNLFREAEFGGVRTWAVSPATFDRNNRRGAFYVLPFTARYEFDRLKV